MTMTATTPSRISLPLMSPTSDSSLSTRTNGHRQPLPDGERTAHRIRICRGASLP